MNDSFAGVTVQFYLAILQCCIYDLRLCKIQNSIPTLVSLNNGPQN